MTTIGVERTEIEKKVWGRAHHAFNSGVCAVSVLDVKAGHRCSWHEHKHRINRFIVHSGSIKVSLDFGKESFVLKAGDVFDVYCGVVHRFEVIEDGVVVEVYWAPLVSKDDINRYDAGGTIDGPL